MERYLKVDQVAALLGLSRTGIYGLVHRRKIPFVKLSRKILLFRESDITAFLERMTVHPKEDQSKSGSGQSRARAVCNRRQRDTHVEKYVDHIVAEAIRDVTVDGRE